MVLTILDLVAIVVAGVVSFVLIMLFITVYDSIERWRDKPEKTRVEKLVKNLERRLKELNHNINKRVDMDLYSHAELLNAGRHICGGLSPSGKASDAEQTVIKVNSLLDEVELSLKEQLQEPTEEVIDNGVEQELVESEKPTDEPESCDEPTVTNEIDEDIEVVSNDEEVVIEEVDIDIEFIKKHKSEGCAFAGEFDFASFVVLTDVEFELTRAIVDPAIYEWDCEASLQSLEHNDGKWFGHIGFIDIDAPAEGTKASLKLKIDKRNEKLDASNKEDLSYLDEDVEF